MQEALARPKVHASFLQRHYRGIVILSLLLADVSSITLGFYLGFRLRLLIPLPEPAQNLHFSDLLPLLALQIVAIVIAFFFGRMYHRQRTRYGADELMTAFSGVSIGTLVSIAVATLAFKSSASAFDYSRGVMIYAWLLTMITVVLVRTVQVRFQRWLQAQGYGRTRVVVVGEGAPAATVLQRLRHNPRLGYDLIGLLTPKGGRLVEGIAPLGPVEELPAVIARENVDEVIIALPEASDEDILRIISMCDRSTMSIKVYPDMFQIMAGQMSIGELGGLPLLNVRDVQLRGWRLTLKRAMDLVGSAVGLVLLSPFLLLIAILIKLDSPGPVFFVQQRMGLDGKPFWLIKFRTMRQDAEQLGTWTVKDDPRRTRLGAFLRRTNIDELPQLINVLIGEMSLVGPRPEQPRYVEEFRARIPRYMERHREKAGMAGWAQVNGLRGDTSIEERTKYDLWYIENWSIWLDIKIILKTIWRTLTREDENAY
ncbi:MAG: undecaprenyl-phosphate glucose phosphotransferase [Anaerolineae bacterium]|nr:undecaprenyl-phosphate glucose phosphotransferase [Thermoflexales bacterium]MDW8406919.1 undecaprenyl-phosphate glucose phosphotransferase [Anaerolineae bacterium]